MISIEHQPFFQTYLKLIFEIIKLDLKGIYNISGGEYLSIFDFVCKIVDIFGYNKSLVKRCKSNKINQKAQRPKNSGLLIDKAIKDFNYLPTKMEVYLKIDKMKKNILISIFLLFALFLFLLFLKKYIHQIRLKTSYQQTVLI